MSKMLIELDLADIEHIIKQSVDEHVDKYFGEIMSRLDSIERNKKGVFRFDVDKNRSPY